MKKLSFVVPALILVGVFTVVTTTFAGTSGSELSTLWNEISGGLQGFWGKLIGILFVGFALVAAKGGNMLMAFAMFILGMVIATIPGILDARYTLLF